MAWVTKDSQETYEKPAPPREYTKAEKAGNWWAYHKWYVIIGVLIAAMLVWIIRDMLFRTSPDYQIGYIGMAELPVDTAEALTTALEQNFCTDRNGDGQVVVQLNQYTLDLTFDNQNIDPAVQMAGVTQLTADLSSADGSYIFLMEDPQAFVEYTGALQYLDGTLPDPDADPATLDWTKMVYRWTDCPVLAGLELGSYTGYTAVDDSTGENQDVLGQLYVGRLAVWNEDRADNYTDAAQLAEHAVCLRRGLDGGGRRLMRLRPKAPRPDAAAAAPNPAAEPPAAPPPGPADLQNPYRRFFTQTPRLEDLARRARAEQAANPRPAGTGRAEDSDNQE